jgi:pimeloyl-ACP methyl ester carboxylesterase
MSNATRTDPETGVVDEVGFFGEGPERMFGALHLPPDEPSAAVLVCSPYQSEFLANYRNEVTLGRALAARGIAAGRFHYRGTGHSDGTSAEVSFGSMHRDALEAMRWFRERVPTGPIAIVGTRWGAVVAASAARSFPRAPLVLWDPAIDGGRYFRDVFRLGRMAQLSDGEPDGNVPAAVDHAARIARDGVTDLVGFQIHRAFYDSAADRDLVAELGDDPRPVLLVQVDLRDRLRAEYADLASRLEEVGFAVDAHVEQGQEAWWFPGTRWQDAAVAERRARIDAATVAWLVERLTPAVVAIDG